MVRSEVCRGRARRALCRLIVVALWLVACPPALAQLSVSSSNQGTIQGLKPVAAAREPNVPPAAKARTSQSTSTRETATARTAPSRNAGGLQ